MRSSFLTILVLALILVGCSTQNNNAQPEWITEVMQAEGTGRAEPTDNPFQTKLMAERASEIVALNNLVQQIYNLPIDNTTVEKLLPADWKISNFTINTVQHQQDGSCKTMVSIPLSHIWNQVQTYRSK